MSWPGVKLIALVLALTTGCSFLLVPKPDPARPEACTTSKRVPYSDIALGATEILPLMITTIFAVPHEECFLGKCEHEQGNPWLFVPITALGGLIVTHFWSAKVGLRRVRQCRALREQPVVPPTYGYPPPPTYR